MMRMGWRKVRRVGVVFLKGQTISAGKTLLSFQALSHAGRHLLRTGKIQVTVPEGVSSGQQIQVGLTVTPNLDRWQCQNELRSSN